MLSSFYRKFTVTNISFKLSMCTQDKE
jgi:hypothetical protein